MKEETVAALNRINERFYSSLAEDFSTTRDGPWPGWLRLLRSLGPLTESSSVDRQMRILDVGCGNGRLQRFLTSELASEMLSSIPSASLLSAPRTARVARPESDGLLASAVDYTGIDSSARLLDEAARRAPSKARWLRVDLTDSEGIDDLSGEHFDLIAVLAVMHHIPSFARRRGLVERIAPLLAEKGVLALSHWQFGRSERFAARAIPWKDHNTQSGDAIDIADLEPGDRLLAWGPDTGRPAERPRRYCHHVDPEEAARLVAELGLDLADTFHADGREGDLNLYQLFRNFRYPNRSGIVIESDP